MHKIRFTRRQFLKLTALSTAALAHVAAAPSQEARAAAEHPRSLSLPQPTFNPIASTTAFGPPTDLAMGWDGTLWALDASGAPHLHDPLADQWNVHGEGVDAVAYDGDTTVYLFRGDQVLTADVRSGQTTAPTTIGTTWPTLPDSFKLGLNGASGFKGKLWLFRGGWYVPADGSTPPAKLLALQNWPATPTWADGLVDAVIGSDDVRIWLFRGAEYIDIDPVAQTVLQGPRPIIGNWDNVIPAAWEQAGFDAGVYFGATFGDYAVFKGPATKYSNRAAIQYLPTAFTGWPATWNPVLNHAPQGRVGNLWVATTAQTILRHDGEQWTEMPGQGVTVGVGQDDTTMVGSATGLYRWNGSGYDALGGSELVQVSVGNAGEVWARNTANNVFKLLPDGSALEPNVQLSGVTHLSANSDGTVWHANNGPNALRLISESSAPSATIPVKAGLVTSVQKVAATGFGSAHVLATTGAGSPPQVYRYDSPYVFKTSTPYNISNYGTLAHGLGLLYLLIEDGFLTGQTVTYAVVAVDAHTGAEVARSAGLTNQRYGGAVFDPIHELVYVGTTPTDPKDQDTQGQLLALDARTLQPVWSFTNNLVSGIDAAPALSGTQLCIGTRNGFVFMLDTNTRAQVWYYGPQPPGGIFQQNIRIATPLITQGRVYAAVYMLTDSGDGVVFVYSAQASDNSASTTNDLGTISKADLGGLFGSSLVFPPALGTADFGLIYDGPAIFVNGGNTLHVIPADPTVSSPNASFTLPSGQISSGFSFDDGSRQGQGLPADPFPQPDRRRVWFGDSLGNLWSLNCFNFTPADSTPYLFKQGTTVNTTPVLYKDPQGGLTVLFGVFDLFGALTGTGVPSLYGYDPDNGNVASVPTGATQILVLSGDTTNGVVYAGGVDFVTLRQTTGQIPQAFGIRVDALPQALRDFIIESQMMQDPDQTAPGGNLNNTDPGGAANPIPPSRARYQTHLTIVDDQKNPQVHEAVKIWADAPTTIRVEGYPAPFDIGPGDSQYASVKTGVDGALVITSGYSKADGSDTPDMYAPALRAWASFMNPFERMVVNPDHEFHQRTSTAHDTAGDDDPDKVNLVTTKSYAGTTNSQTPSPLFTAGEVQQGQPGKCATAIGQMKSGVGFGAGGNDPTNAASALFGKLMLHTSGRKQAHRALRRSAGRSAGRPTAAGAPAALAAPLPKYVAYANLPNLGYFPTNIPAARPTTVVQPTGLIFSQPAGQPPEATTLQVVHHTDAQAAFDALPPPSANPPWQVPVGMPFNSVRRADGVYVITGTQNIFTDFWNWLKGLFAKITALIVSIADEVMVGINLIVNGIEQVFKAIVKVIDDIASAIGSFFKMILKFIEDVIAALSVLFHFGEIMWTHRWLAGQFQGRVNDMTAAITGTIEPALNSFFEAGEAAVKGFFDQLRQDLTGSASDSSQPLSGLKGMGATPHTVFSAQPGSAGPNSGGASHATQCTYGIQKFKSGAPSATSPAMSKAIGRARASASEGAAGPSSDPLTDFFTTFIARLTGDGDLAATVAQLKSDFGNLFKASSAKQFFTTLLVTLLDLVETLIIGALAVVNALFDGFLAVITDAINAVVSVLTTEIEIPFITWLYQTLFGEPLTFLNLATLIVAIPVTLVCRVVEGKYPQDLFPPIGALRVHQAMPAGATTPASTTAAPAVVQRYLGLFVGILTIVQGVANAIGDSQGEGEASTVPAKASLGIGLVIEAFTFPLIDNDATDVTSLDWAEYGVGLGSTLFGVTGINDLGLNSIDEELIPYLTNVLNVGLLAVTITAFVKDGKTDAGTDVGFAAGLIYCLPGMANPIKMFGEEAALVVSAIDFIAFFVVGALQIAQAFITTESLVPGPHRLHVPMLHTSPLDRLP